VPPGVTTLLGPLLLALPAWLLLVVALRHGRRDLAATGIAVWALVMMGGLPVAEKLSPGFCSRIAPGAGSYASSMLDWAETGDGCESTPSCFIPQQLWHAAVFVVATVATAGLGGLYVAGILFSWMGAYSAGLAAMSSSPATAVLLAWHPWAVVRVAAYIALGVVLAEPLARRGLPPLPNRRAWLFAGGIGLLLDILLKLAFASSYWRLAIHPLLVR
jgi:hypothetical protein